LESVNDVRYWRTSVVDAMLNELDSQSGADWGRKAALAYMDKAAHFLECPRGSYPRLRGGGGFGFEKFLENDSPNSEKSHIPDQCYFRERERKRERKRSAIRSRERELELKMFRRTRSE